VVLAVANTLKNLFPDVPVNRELMNDGSFEAPSFFVNLLSTRVQRAPTKTGFMTYSFDVAYFGALNVSDAFQELHGVSYRLTTEALYLLSCEGEKIGHIGGSNVEIVDQVLHWQFSTTIRVADHNDAPVMQDIKYEGGKINGDR
jgi:hypothetical protein